MEAAAFARFASNLAHSASFFHSITILSVDVGAMWNTPPNAGWLFLNFNSKSSFCTTGRLNCCFTSTGV